MKRAAPPTGEDDEESGAPAVPTKKVESTTLHGRTAVKDKPAKGQKIEKAAPAVVKIKAPVIAPDPPPPPVPVVPLTPITPRNP